MTGAVPPLILLAGAAALIAVRLLRPGFVYQWLGAVVLALAAWIAALASRAFPPASLAWLNRYIEAPASTRLPFRLDETAWGYALALATLLLATLLTAAAQGGRADLPRPSAPLLAGGLALTALCMFAVQAGELHTFLLAWAAATLLEGVVWLRQVSTQEEAAQFGLEMGLRLASLLAALAGMLVALPSYNLPAYLTSSPLAAAWLIVAAGLRLGAIPPHSAPTRQIPLPPALGPLLRLATCAPALYLLQQVAAANVSGLTGLLFALIVVAAWRAGWILTGGEDQNAARLAWIPAAGALALAGAFYGLPQAVFAWGTTLLLAGGTFLQHAVRPAWLRPLFWVSAIGLTGLAFTPTWGGAALYAQPGAGPLLLLAAQSLLTLGWLRQSSQPGPAMPIPERWVWALYLAGLALGPLTLFSLPFAVSPASPSGWLGRVTLENLLPGVLVCGLALLIFGLRSLARRRFDAFARGMRSVLGLEWLYRLLPPLLQPLRFTLRLSNRLLESQAGMVWAFLLLVLFLTLISGSLTEAVR